MFRSLPVRLCAALLLLTVSRGNAQSLSGLSSESTSRQRNLLLVVDSSGSMAGRTMDGSMKMSAAKQTLQQLIQSLPDKLHVGLLAFGHRYSTKHSQTCQDIELLAPVALTDRSLLAGKVQVLSPRGKTPLSRSLAEAVNILQQRSGDREQALVVVTDGLETCGGDILAVAAELRQLRVQVEFYLVGFDLIPQERDVLRQVARAGGGTFLNAPDAAQLVKVFETLREELIVRAPAIQRKVIVVEGTGPGFLRTVGNQVEGIGNFIVVILKREDTLVELRRTGAEQGLTFDGFWGHGARILKVAQDSPAERAGLLPGDLIVQVDETPVQTGRQLHEVLTAQIASGDETAVFRLRVARFAPMNELLYSTSEPKTLELPPGVYHLSAVQRVPGRLSDYVERVGSWLVLDQTSPAYLTPLLWNFRVESEKTYEVPLNVGIRLQHSQARYNDELKLVEGESGTEVRFTPGDFGFRKGPFAATLPIPPGRYTIQWKRRDGDHWYTVIEDHDYDGRSLVTLQF